LAVLQARLGTLFGRPEPRQQAGRYLEGLLSAVERKNGWQLAEQIGDARPWRTQRVLSHVLWDEDAARDLCRNYVVEHLGSNEGVLIVDETGFLKKGAHSAGVARQYTGTAGRIENAQVGVFLAYASPTGHALIDRALYLPRKEWCEDAARRAAAAIPEAVAFATKPALARRMIGRALDAGLRCTWVLGEAGQGSAGAAGGIARRGDEVYGSDRPLRMDLEERGQPFVLAIRSNEKLWSVLGDRLGQHAAADLARAVPTDVWQCLSGGPGAKGERLYETGRGCA
jgi:SRSO17 transposase